MGVNKLESVAVHRCMCALLTERRVLHAFICTCWTHVNMYLNNIPPAVPPPVEMLQTTENYPMSFVGGVETSEKRKEKSVTFTLNDLSTTSVIRL